MNGGMLELTPEMGDIPPVWTVYFTVEDIQQAVQQVEALGGVHRPPFDTGAGPVSVVHDPQHAMFNLIQLTVPADEAPTEAELAEQAVPLDRASPRRPRRRDAPSAVERCLRSRFNGGRTANHVPA